MNYKLVVNRLLIFSWSIAISFARSIAKGEFQFQCYGTRTLCMYPTEYCSSEVEKCISCSPAVCSNKGNIPLSCTRICSGEPVEEEEKEDSNSPLLQWLIVVSVIAAMSLLLHTPGLKNKIRNFIPLCRDRSPRMDENTKYSSVSSSETSVGTTSASTQTDSICTVQPSNVEAEDHQRDTTCNNCYGEAKLKAVSPVQDASGEYHEQVTSNSRMLGVHRSDD